MTWFSVRGPTAGIVTEHKVVPSKQRTLSYQFTRTNDAGEPRGRVSKQFRNTSIGQFVR